MTRKCVTSPERKAVIAAACKKFPRLGHKAVAQRLLDKHPEFFPTFNSAETAVRWHRGARGERAARDAKARGTFRLPPIPDPVTEPWLPFELDARRVLGLSDIHIPFHDKPALQAALKYGDKINPDCVLINGDLWDAKSLSHWKRDPRGPSSAQELKMVGDFLDHLRARYRRARIIWKEGNHEEWWYQFLWSHAPEILDVCEFSWEKQANVEKNGVEMVRDKRIIMLGKLPVLHGHELQRGIASPVNPARGAFLQVLDSVLVGHWHRQADHTERTIHGHIIGCRATGCLCGLNPEYAPVNKWSHGFATIHVAKDGTYEVQLKKVIHGKVY